MKRKIMLIAAEASGDYLGSELISALKDYDCYGIGGERMQALGMRCLMQSDNLSVMGLWPVIRRLKVIYQALRQVKKSLISEHPDLLILIDYPGFNLKIAKMAHQRGIKVLYYVSPKIWAWRYRRIFQIKKSVDHMVLLFPFEHVIYQRHAIPSTVVGHPLLNVVPPHLAPLDCKKNLGLDEKEPIIGLLAGSRKQEIQNLMPVINESIAAIKKRHPKAQFVLALADTIRDDIIKPYLKEQITLVRGQLYSVIKAADAVICCSGTVTLEVALLAVPMVIIYRLSAMGYWLAKKLVRTPWIGLCHIVAGEKICQEFIQNQAHAQHISQEIHRLLVDLPYRQQIIHKLQHTREHLGEHHRIDQLLNIIQQMMD